MKLLYLVLPLLSVLISTVSAEKVSDSSGKKNMLSLKKTTKDLGWKPKFNLEDMINSY